VSTVVNLDSQECTYTHIHTGWV